MAHPQAVYLSRDPSVLEQFDSWAERRQQWGDRLHKVVMSVSPYSKAKTTIYTTSRPNRFAGIGARFRSTWEKKSDSDLPTMEELKEKGWRLDRKNYVLLPNKSTAPGKELARKLDTIGTCTWSEMPGQPGMLFVDLRLLHAGYERHDGPPGGYLLAMWGLWTPELEKQVDRDLWAPMELSKYYALHEEAIPEGKPS